LGISYEFIQWQKLSLDGCLYQGHIGAGISYDCWKNINLGIEETASYKDGELKTRLYLSILLSLE
jgi:hypothetical protein